MTERLDVYLCDRHAGALERDGGRMSFRYLPEYLQSDSPAVVSSTLPLSDRIYEERDVMAFFSNLLPDEGVRRRIAEIVGVTPEDTFGLLREIGGDCAGAIAFWPPGKRPCRTDKPVYRELTDAEADDVLRNLGNRPLGIDEDFRGISGAGAQDKLIACLRDGKILLPLRGTPSTHIIKPEIERFPFSVQNEHFCMELSRRCGFDTAECGIARFGELDYYVTRRYDRADVDGIVRRLHQEDFCQLLKCRPEIKYQDQGGPSVVECVRPLRELHLPGSDVMSFVDRVVFNFLIGNGDAHGKNFSVVYRDGMPRLSPQYDLICTTVYPQIGKKMAMKFDGKFEFRWITTGKIIRTFERAGIGEKLVRDSIERQTSSIRRELPGLVDEIGAKFPSSVYHDICKGVHARIRQLAK